jgi:hypothetical protein
MSIDENDAEAQVKRDFKRYLKGEQPLPQQLTQAPLLSSWRTCVVPFGPASPPSVMVLAGRVVNHPLLGDDGAIHTSQLIWLDRNRKWARTWNRVYRLGEPVGGDTEDES